MYAYDHNNRYLLYCIGMEKTKYLYFLLAFAFDQCCGARLSFLGWIVENEFFGSTLAPTVFQETKKLFLKQFAQNSRKF